MHMIYVTTTEKKKRKKEKKSVLRCMMVKLPHTIYITLIVDRSPHLLQKRLRVAGRVRKRETI